MLNTKMNIEQAFYLFSTLCGEVTPELLEISTSRNTRGRDGSMRDGIDPAAMLMSITFIFSYRSTSNWICRIFQGEHAVDTPRLLAVFQRLDSCVFVAETQQPLTVGLTMGIFSLGIRIRIPSRDAPVV